MFYLFLSWVYLYFILFLKLLFNKSAFFFSVDFNGTAKKMCMVNESFIEFQFYLHLHKNNNINKNQKILPNSFFFFFSSKILRIDWPFRIYEWSTMEQRTMLVIALIWMKGSGKKRQFQCATIKQRHLCMYFHEFMQKGAFRHGKKRIPAAFVFLLNRLNSTDEIPQSCMDKHSFLFSRPSIPYPCIVLRISNIFFFFRSAANCRYRYLCKWILNYISQIKKKMNGYSNKKK